MVPAPFRILAYTAAHFVVSLANGVVAYGLDMDQLRSRSLASRTAGVLHDLLWFPHDTFMRAKPVSWVVEYPWIIPGAIVANSLLYGLATYLLLRVLERRRGARIPHAA